MEKAIPPAGVDQLRDPLGDRFPYQIDPPRRTLRRRRGKVGRRRLVAGLRRTLTSRYEFRSSGKRGVSSAVTQSMTRWAGLHRPIDRFCSLPRHATGSPNAFRAGRAYRP